MYTLVWTANFTRTAKKFLASHPDLRPKVADILRDLENDPFQSHLKFHRLIGN